MILKPVLSISIVMLRVVFCFVAIVTMGRMMNAGAAERPVVNSTDYDDVSFNELISVYKQAYVEAGFKFKKQTTEVRRGASLTNLDFEFSIPEYPKKKKGVASLVIYSPYSESHDCTPCKVYMQFFGIGYHSDYDPTESVVATRIMNSANLKANAQIKMKLGKSVWPAPAHIDAREE